MLIFALAVVTTAIAGALIGVPTLRLRGDYIAIVTLAFGEIIGQVVSNGRQIEVFGGTLTSGPIGIGPHRIQLPLVGRFGALDLCPRYWVALALVALALVVNVNLRDSRLGRAWLAMRHDELGRRVLRHSRSPAPSSWHMGRELRSAGSRARSSPPILVWCNPAQFEFSFSIFILAMVVLGGILGSIAGVVVGAILLSVVNNSPAARRPVRPSEQGRPGVRLVGDQRRHLRRDPRGGDASPTAGPRAGSLPDAVRDRGRRSGLPP